MGLIPNVDESAGALFALLQAGGDPDKRQQLANVPADPAIIGAVCAALRMAGAADQADVLARVARPSMCDVADAVREAWNVQQQQGEAA